MAAGKVDVTIEGDEEFLRGLAELAEGLKHLEEPHRIAAGMIAEAAASRAPRLTGALAASIRPSVADNAGIVTVGVPYGGVIEYGWPQRNIIGQPYLWPAGQGTEGAWRPVYDEAVNALIAKVHGA